MWSTALGTSPSCRRTRQVVAFQNPTHFGDLRDSSTPFSPRRTGCDSQLRPGLHTSRCGAPMRASPSREACEPR